MSERVTWGVWCNEHASWACDAQGKIFVSGDLDRIGEYQTGLQRERPDRTFHVYAIGDDGQPQRAVLTDGGGPKKTPLWGWCYKDIGNKLTWMLAVDGKPVFSEHRHEILAYNLAVCQGEPDRAALRLACMVGKDGHPVESGDE